MDIWKKEFKAELDAAIERVRYEKLVAETRMNWRVRTLELQMKRLRELIFLDDETRPSGESASQARKSKKRRSSRRRGSTGG